jgi:hypothetical protein
VKPSRGLKLWSLLVHVLAVAVGVTVGVLSYRWIALH